MAIVSISQAAKLVRKGRQTLYNHNRNGKLSFTKTDEGKPGVDTSELERVYGKLYMPADKIDISVKNNESHVNSHTNHGVGSGVRRSTNLDMEDNLSAVRSDSIVQMDSVGPGVNNHATKTVSMNVDTVSTLSWLIEELDETKKSLADTKAQLEERDQTLTELRKAIAVLPSPESVERRLAQQADQFERQHKKIMAAEREQLSQVLAEEKQRAARESKIWQQSIEDRAFEIRQARAEADEIRQRKAEQAQELKAERDRIVALESRGLIARLLNRRLAPAR